MFGRPSHKSWTLLFWLFTSNAEENCSKMLDVMIKVSQYGVSDTIHIKWLNHILIYCKKKQNPVVFILVISFSVLQNMSTFSCAIFVCNRFFGAFLSLPIRELVLPLTPSSIFSPCRIKALCYPVISPLPKPVNRLLSRS